LLLDILATILSGGLSTHQINSCTSEYSVSQVFISVNIKNLHNFPAIDNSINQIVDDLHKSNLVQPSESIRYPGEHVLHLRRENVKEGIPVSRRVWEDLTML
jgi:3-dehydro-L-gulonate 2-dehydrogenase